MKTAVKVFVSSLILICSLFLICFLSFAEGQQEGGTTPPVTEGASSATLPSVFADGMVFQRQKPIRVYGFCDVDGREITVTLGEQSKTCQVSDGEWEVVFDAMEAAKGLTLTVTENCEEPTPVVFRDVNIGEVWVVSGQSNARLQMAALEDYEEFLLNAHNHGNIYLYSTTPGSVSATNKVNTVGNGKWFHVNSREVIEGLNSSQGYLMSAIGYITATRLAAELGEDIPVAIIHAAQSASSIRAWIDIDSFNELHEDSSLTWVNKITGGDLATREAYYSFYEANGRFPKKDDAAYVAREDQCVPGVLYEHNLYHLRGFSARGVIWYQGEREEDRGIVDDYSHLFSALQKSMNKTFGTAETDGLPFFVVQLAPYATKSYNSAGYYYKGWDRLSNFREEQFDMISALPNTYIVSTANDGTMFSAGDLEYGAATQFIHPSRKSPVANRAANDILKRIYGIGADKVVTAPTPLSATVSGGTLTVSFDSNLILSFGDKVEGFELSQDGTSWYAAAGVISGNTVTLSCPELSNPTMVRYAHGFSLVELRDGKLISFSTNYRENNANVNTTGNTAQGYSEIVDIFDDNAMYRIYPGAGDSIRTKLPGNVTNASGAPLFAFKLKAQ